MSKLSKEVKEVVKDIVSKSVGLNVDEIAFKFIRETSYSVRYEYLIEYIQKRLNKQKPVDTFEDLGIDPIGKKTCVVNICHVNRGEMIDADLTVVYGDFAREGVVNKPSGVIYTGEEVYDEEEDGMVPEIIAVSGTDEVITPTGKRFSINGLEDNDLTERSCLLDGISLAVTLAQGKWLTEDCRVVFKIYADKYDYGSKTNSYYDVKSIISNYSSNLSWEFELYCDNEAVGKDLEELLGLERSL